VLCPERKHNSASIVEADIMFNPQTTIGEKAAFLAISKKCASAVGIEVERSNKR
jgi:hypothetical protein